eukprot:maker-scaffold334_size202906-snap-gene-1.27 protein:Tk08969 transcript:maker-scaffold334_size202906-snap-gene-1.27-mRNA-1 annotation:"hypothetical protein KGM_22524"
MVFRKANESDPRISSEVQIFIENLPKDVAIPELCQFFSSVGQIKQDRMSKQPRVWLYHDKATGQPTGECTITYRDSDTQKRALQEYNLAEFNGCTITVTPSIVKSHMAKGALPRGRGGVRGGMPRGRGRGGGGFDRSQSGGDEDYFTRRGEQSRGGFGRESNRVVNNEKISALRALSFLELLL